MPKYNYTAISKDGKKHTTTGEAENQEALLDRLQSQGFTVTSINPLKIEPLREDKVSGEAQLTPTLAGVRIKARQTKTHARVKLVDLVLFSRQLATMLGAGVTLLRCLETISLQIQSRGLLKAVEGIKKDVESGRSFSNSLADYPQVFSKLWANLAEAGEASGNLPIVLERLANYLEERAAFRTKVISAMVYPLILAAASILAILFFTIVIIPKFFSIFEAFQIEPPLITQALIILSNFLRHGIIFIIIGVIFLALMLRAWFNTAAGRRFFDSLGLQLPLLGEVIQAIQIERFASGISMLLESGVPILYSLEISQHSLDNVLMQDAVAATKESVRSGQTLHQPMQKSGLFPAMVTQMIAIGEEIGELPKMFKKVSFYYQQFLETFVIRLTVSLEPAMIIVMGVVIGTMVIAMYLPIFQIATGGR